MYKIMDGYVSAESELLRQNYIAIRDGIKSSSEHFCDELFATGFLSGEARSIAKKPTHTGAERARILLDEVIDRVRKNPNMFATFVSILKEGDLTKEIATDLETKLVSSKAAEKPQNVDEDWMEDLDPGLEDFIQPFSRPRLSASGPLSADFSQLKLNRSAGRHQLKKENRSSTMTTDDIGSKPISETKKRSSSFPKSLSQAESASSLVMNSPRMFEGAGTRLMLEWISSSTRCPKRIERPCDATSVESIAYFRKYRSTEIFSFDNESRKWGSFTCDIIDTTLVVVPIEFGGEEALHLVGGKMEHDGSFVKDLYYYKYGAWKKSKYTPMQVARKQAGAVCHEKKYLIVIGGYGEHAPTKVVDFLNLEKKQWFRTVDISFENFDLQQVHFMNEVVLLSHLAMYGTGPILKLLDDLECTEGLNMDRCAEDLIKDLELYMPKLNEEFKKELQEKRDLLEKALLKELGLYRMSVCICDKNLYILGGFTNIYGQSALRTVFRADLEKMISCGTLTYTKAPDRKVFKPVEPLPYIRSACVTFKGRVLAIGGSEPLRNNECTREVYEYQPVFDQWTLSKGSLCDPRCDCFAAVFKAQEDEELMVFGGRPKNQDNPCTNSVEFAGEVTPTKPEVVQQTSIAGNTIMGFDEPKTKEIKSPPSEPESSNQPGLNLRNLYRETYDARAEWRSFLTELDVNQDTIAAIGDEWRKSADCLHSGITEWLKGGERGWKDVVDALSSPTVGYNALAQTIKKKYLQ